MFKNIFNKNNNSKPNMSINRSDNDLDLSIACLEMLTVAEDEYFSIQKEHMQATHLSMIHENLQILQEGIGDFFNSVINFFKNLLEKFKAFMKKAFMFLNAYIGDFDNFLNKYKEELLKLNPDFSYKGFKYTTTRELKLHSIETLINEFNDDLHNLKELKIGDIIEMRKRFNEPTNLNKIRGSIIGASSIDEDRFDEECFKYFRSGEYDAIDLDIKKNDISSYIAEYPGVKKSLKTASENRDKTITMVESIKKFFEKGASVSYNGKSKSITTYDAVKNVKGTRVVDGTKGTSAYSSDELRKVNAFYNFKFQQSKIIGNLAINASCDKVNAIKEQLKQTKAIIRQGMSSKNKKVEKKVGED